MGKEAITEVLQWMHLAMGTEASSIFSDDQPATLTSVLDRLQQLKAESDNHRARADRYKRKLETANASWKIESEDLKKKLDQSLAENEKYKIELKSGTDAFQETLKVERAKISQLEKEIEVSRKEIDRYKGELLYAAKSLSVVRPVYSQMGELEEMVKRMHSDCLNLRRLSSSHSTIRARFTDISKLSSSSDLQSKPVTVGGMDWSISIRTHTEDAVKYLSAHLLLAEKNLPTDWSCTVHNQMRLFSPVSATISFGMGVPAAAVFTDIQRKCGFNKFIPLKTLLDGKYIMEDSIIIAVDLFIFPTS